MDELDIETIETDLLLEAVFKRYGYDFRNYARASLKRGVQDFLRKTPFKRPSEVISALLDERVVLADLLQSLSIGVTEMFRDPFVYRAIRDKVVPFLKTFPFIKIWHAGCATGEEVYSLAILLKEEGIYNRSRIYATDFNEEALERAGNGIYPIDPIKTYTSNYQRSGGGESFSDYYHSKYDSVIMNPDLKRNIVFAHHNLATDSGFGEMQFILCRNVLIYFDRELQNRVLRLFMENLVFKGFLCLGTKESILFSDVADRFKVFMEKEKILQRI